MNLIRMQKMRKQLEEWEHQENVEREENRVRMKALNQHPTLVGFCDDWDSHTHADVHEAWCPTCNDEIIDAEEFIVLECTCVHHTSCLVPDYEVVHDNCPYCNQ